MMKKYLGLFFILNGALVFSFIFINSGCNDDVYFSVWFTQDVDVDDSFIPYGSEAVNFDYSYYLPSSGPNEVPDDLHLWVRFSQGSNIYNYKLAEAPLYDRDIEGNYQWQANLCSSNSCDIKPQEGELLVTLGFKDDNNNYGQGSFAYNLPEQELFLNRFYDVFTPNFSCTIDWSSISHVYLENMFVGSLKPVTINNYDGHQRTIYYTLDKYKPSAYDNLPEDYVESSHITLIKGTTNSFEIPRGFEIGGNLDGSYIVQFNYGSYLERDLFNKTFVKRYISNYYTLPVTYDCQPSAPLHEAIDFDYNEHDDMKRINFAFGATGWKLNFIRGNKTLQDMNLDITNYQPGGCVNVEEYIKNNKGSNDKAWVCSVIGFLRQNSTTLELEQVHTLGAAVYGTTGACFINMGSDCMTNESKVFAIIHELGHQIGSIDHDYIIPNNTENSIDNTHSIFCVMNAGTANYFDINDIGGSVFEIYVDNIMNPHFCAGCCKQINSKASSFK